MAEKIFEIENKDKSKCVNTPSKGEYQPPSYISSENKISEQTPDTKKKNSPFKTFSFKKMEISRLLKNFRFDDLLLLAVIYLLMTEDCDDDLILILVFVFISGL